MHARWFVFACGFSFSFNCVCAFAFTVSGLLPHRWPPRRAACWHHHVFSGRRGVCPHHTATVGHGARQRRQSLESDVAILCHQQLSRRASSFFRDHNTRGKRWESKRRAHAWACHDSVIGMVWFSLRVWKVPLAKVPISLDTSFFSAFPLSISHVDMHPTYFEELAMCGRCI